MIINLLFQNTIILCLVKLFAIYVPKLRAVQRQRGGGRLY
uniref:Uncharacterized protein n=1 Tax=Anguilla anguilla TaxID=7936 RepID=A0A0E9SZ89_ANGAN